MVDVLERTGRLERSAYWAPFGDFARLDWGPLLLETLRAISRAEGKTPPMTPSADGKIDRSLAERIHRPELLAAGTPEEFVARWLGGDEFFVVISHLSAWNEKLHDMAYECFVRPLTDSGHPVGAVDVYAVLGNCGATPFGVHCDDEPIFLAHTGPNAKEVWYRDEPPAGSDPESVRQWLALADHRVMEIGDVVFIPAGTYHLLRSDGFSVSLGFDVFPADPDTSPDRALRLRSNGYLVAPPAVPCAGDREAGGFAAAPGSRIELSSEQEDHVSMYMRGRKVTFPATPWLPEALKLLGGTGIFSMDELTAATGSPEASRQILSLALSLGAIRSVDARHA